VGIDLSYLHVFAAVAFHDFVGIGPKAGVEFFTSEDFSLGVQVEAGFYFAPQLGRLTTRLQAALTANVYF
jgi:outer membrane protein